LLEVIIVAGFAWIFGGWLIAKRPTLGFMVFSFVSVVILSVAVGFVFAGLLAVFLGVQNIFGAAFVGGMRGFIFGAIFGGWSIVRRFRSIKIEKSLTTAEERK